MCVAKKQIIITDNIIFGKQSFSTFMKHRKLLCQYFKLNKSSRSTFSDRSFASRTVIKLMIYFVCGDAKCDSCKFVVMLPPVNLSARIQSTRWIKFKRNDCFHQRNYRRHCINVLRQSPRKYTSEMLILLKVLWKVKKFREFKEQ